MLPTGFENKAVIVMLLLVSGSIKMYQMKHKNVFSKAVNEWQLN